MHSKYPPWTINGLGVLFTDMDELKLCILYEICDASTYPSPNLNGCTFAVLKRVSNFISLFTEHVSTQPCWD